MFLCCCKITFFVVLMLKFFCLASDMDTMEIAWGVDIEPVLAMVSLAFGKNYILFLFTL